MTEQMMELADRCEAAKGPYQRRMLSESYREIFGGPECIVIDRWPGYQSPRWDSFHKMLEAKAYLDAAMQLVPDDLWIEAQIGDTRTQVLFGRNGEWNNDPKLSGYARTPALALCAAALRARAQSENLGGGE